MCSKHLILVLFFAGLVELQLYGQIDSLKGKINLKIFSNFHYGLTREDNSTAFDIKRAYFGYEQDLGGNFSAQVKLDIGSPDDLSQFSLIRRYTYFKNASLKYEKDKITAWFGLFDMLQYKLQEDFWNYRYIYKSFQDEHKYGPSADLGTGIRYRWNNIFSSDLVISNGEGYKDLQTDRSYDLGFGSTVSTLQGIILRAYYDFIIKDRIQYDLSFFAAYSRLKYRLAAEYNLRYNSSFYENHNLTGWSWYGTYIINDKWEIFGRYDILHSNVLIDENLPWDIYNDGSAIIAGFQFSPIKKVRISPNYQDWFPYARNTDNHSFFYLNLQFEI